MSAPEETAPAWRRGLVTAISKHKAKVKFPDMDGMISDWLPVTQMVTMGAKAWIMPRVGAQVVVLLDEHGEDGIILGGIYSGADPAPGCSAGAFHLELEDGTTLTLDAGKITLDTPGKVEVTAGGDVDVVATGHVNATCATAKISATTSITLETPLVEATQILKVNGVIQANGGITTTSGGSIPGDLKMAGTVQSDTGVTAPDASLGGKSFNAHTHRAQGSTAVTTAPL